jgi:ferredoxin
MSFKIEFKKTGKTVEWNGQYPNILELAEANGMAIPSDCRMGVCGTCKTRLLSGKVRMETEDALTDEDKEQGMFLPCVSVPQTDLVIDA